MQEGGKVVLVERANFVYLTVSAHDTTEKCVHLGGIRAPFTRTGEKPVFPAVHNIKL